MAVPFLKDIKNEVMSFVVRPRAGVKVVPIPVIDWNAAVWRIPMVKMVELLVPLEIVRIVDVGIVVEPVPIGGLATTGRLGGRRCQI